MKIKKLDIEINYIRLCPYCKKRKIKRVTCGDPFCQYHHHIAKMKDWWKGPGKIFNGRRKTYMSDYTRKRRENKIDWYSLNQEKVKVHRILKAAIASGKIIRIRVCQKCGSKQNIDAHHEDYSRPLFVTWLCKSCHRKLHTENLANNIL